jgi:hypothetical protein
METSTRPDPSVDRAAARRNYVIFSIAAALLVTMLVTAVTLVLV